MRRPQRVLAGLIPAWSPTQWTGCPAGDDHVDRGWNPLLDRPLTACYNVVNTTANRGRQAPALQGGEAGGSPLEVTASVLELSHRLLYRPELLARVPEAKRLSGEPGAGAQLWLEALGPPGPADAAMPGPRQLEAQARFCQRERIGAVLLGEASYPAALRALALPPPVLFCKGRMPPVSGKRIAIVGSRRSSRAGKDFAHALGRAAASAAIPVISGLARGIDQAAHRGCLEMGPTWAVLGCGLDRLYPPEAGRLAAAVTLEGGLLSEIPPGCPPLPFHFPRRNRIIASLGDALVVVEAGARSGALSTVAEATALGRNVGVAPGSPLSPASAGSNRLFFDGAKPVLCPDDMFALLGGGGGKSEAREPAPWTAERCRREKVSDLETLAARSGWLFTEAIEALATWEREGLVLRLPAGEFRVLDGATDPEPTLPGLPVIANEDGEE